MNELQQRRLQKQYEDYYKMYNKLVRPMQEKKEATVVDGIVSWDETNVTNQTIKLIKGGY